MKLNYYQQVVLKSFVWWIMMPLGMVMHTLGKSPFPSWKRLFDSYWEEW